MSKMKKYAISPLILVTAGPNFYGGCTYRWAITYLMGFDLDPLLKVTEIKFKAEKISYFL